MTAKTESDSDGVRMAGKAALILIDKYTLQRIHSRIGEGVEMGLQEARVGAEIGECCAIAEAVVDAVARAVVPCIKRDRVIVAPEGIGIEGIGVNTIDFKENTSRLDMGEVVANLLV
jgi:hypothetical protein